MVVMIPRGKMAYFRRKARKNANEIMAVLGGKRVAPNLIEIYDFYYPNFLSATPTSYEASPEQMQEVYDEISDAEQCVVGSIHSHPGKDAPLFMSKTDFLNHKESGDHICGICEASPNRSFIQFWTADCALPCTKKFY